MRVNNLSTKRPPSAALHKVPRTGDVRRTEAVSVLLGVLSGALLVLSLPKPDLYPLAWIALVPLLAVVVNTESVVQVILASYVSGVIFFAGSCYWIT
jgi:apolipoprotein N-acyltransferase